MKMKFVISMALLALTAGCASTSNNQEFKEGANNCAMICKANPDLKEYSQSHGGGLFLVLFGGEEQKCACNRQP